jgi:hypothetical protein
MVMTSQGKDDEASQDVDDCPVCRQLRDEGPDGREFCVAPDDGGGWQLWSAALLRFIVRMGHQPTQAVIITQPMVSERYLQFLVGHGIAHAEVGSNVYLTGESRLSPDAEVLLAELGWLAPTLSQDDPDEMPANWSLPLIVGDWGYLVEMLLASMVGVLGFDSRLPIEVRSFGCDHPCRDCSWPDESLETAR